MEYIYKNTSIFYKIIGNGDVPIVFLHGWGGSTKSFEFLLNQLNFNYKAILLDFPPFGKSQIPASNFTIFDYALIVEQILQKHNIIKPIIVGHSFGGRVAILLASKNLAKCLVLASSAGLKPKRGAKYYFRVIKHKFCKHILKKNSKGSKDYNNLPQNMKKTFSNIVTTFLEDYAININVPTILFWGANDKETPFYMAKKLKRLINDCEIIKINKAGHFAYISSSKLFVNIINEMSKVN